MAGNQDFDERLDRGFREWVKLAPEVATFSGLTAHDSRLPPATREALFARLEYLQKNQAAVQVFVEELVRVNREINKNPMSIVEERKKLGLLKDLPAKLEEELPTYFKEGVAGGIFPNDGGAESAAKTDLEFFALSGSIKKENPKVDDYWHLAPLKAALSRLK